MANDGLLTRRGSDKLYVIAAVPTDLVPVLKRSQIWRSTKTADRAEARRRAIIIRAEIEGEFARARMTKDARRHVRQISDEHLEGLARELFDYTLAEDDKMRRYSTETGNADLTAGVRPSYLAAMQSDLSKGHFHHISWWVEHVATRDALAIVKDSEDYRYLAYLCQRAQIDAVKILIARDNGNFTLSAMDPMVLRKPEPPAKSRMSALFETYAETNPGGVKPDKINTDRYAIGLFVEYAGDLDPAAVTRDHIREWRKLLVCYPVRAAQMSSFKDMPIRAVIEANGTLRKPVLSRRTVNKQLSAVSVFLDWCIAEGFRDSSNPCTGLPRLKENMRKVRSFDAAELVALFADPWFAAERGHRFWLPILSLYSGARLGELAQLNTIDVRAFHGHICFHFTDLGDGEKSLKNANSARIVPVHRALIDIGFIDYVGRQKAGRVFPDVARNQRGQWAADVSRDFGRLLRRLGLKGQDEAPKLDFHSLRHTFADGMRTAGYADNEFDVLLGHKASMTGRYGNDKAHVVERKAAMIEALTYDFDLLSIFKVEATVPR
ncbi:site-specific integrase [Acuticoccus kandeliae]|uniref:site-specific integrase n=1 Tax=Acuticoccus kandeliae TaxID=2073160 RepID=UPI001300B53E|nr:site-specific integrase [Acuticoccus kandeliae]